MSARTRSSATDADRTAPRSAYLSFGGGRRSCVGQSFASVEMALIAAIMTQRFTFGLALGPPGESRKQIPLCRRLRFGFGVAVLVAGI
jgi:cytochrome P450